MTDATTVLAFDFGLRRIGVAVGQTISGSATPLTTLIRDDLIELGNAIDQLIVEWKPDVLLVGEPLKRTDADDLFSALAVFVEELEERGLPVQKVDEAASSMEATARLNEQRRAGSRGRIRKAEIDAMAASVIAERWLQFSH